MLNTGGNNTTMQCSIIACGENGKFYLHSVCPEADKGGGGGPDPPLSFEKWRNAYCGEAVSAPLVDLQAGT